ncbi:gastric inhibitory polypeptide receptor [Triplophysa dalaica]|uniref:gastric inhibitory polypeptide receptor n=1 Tax=Triplophysa dalaica TaxID=1582913 RepID=UPI0024E0330A|nr:gastric inhibitory polypeptide receptor [Triplophysa dalaica]XP_056613328.1 gastric inhibitory polypeptide receptor [Triplophysa dalaica]XP_056613329.1 gastric inhibitory polypeptide receptor [Triplophysa dalaica]
MKSAPTIFLLTLSVLCRAESVSGKTVKDTVQEWNRYRNECLSKISAQPTPSGLFCKPMFDMYACWTNGVPNTTVKVPCPWYLPWYDQVRNGFVKRDCGPDGQWQTVNSSRTWRDHSQCDADSRKQLAQENQMLILAYFRVIYTIGYSLSLASLSLALVILLIFRKLRCTRNYIHTNLFASFILRALSILTRDALLMKDAPEFRDNKDVSIVLSEQVMSSCRVAQVLMQYCVGANYYWLLVEGLYLHNLLVLMVFSKNSYFCVYLFIGWGTPVLFVVPWIVVRYLHENTRCWEINENLGYWWIIRTPIVLAILVNFFIFIRIIQILISKLKAHQMRYTDYKFRLAKSTLTLIPLLGIHEVVFALLTAEQTEGVLHNLNLFFELFFNSFQGFLVAILYCFVNKEVQSEIKKKWQRWKLGISILDEQRNTGSNTQQGGAMPLCHHNPPCSHECPLDSASQLSSDPTPSGSQLSTQHHYHPGAKKGKAYCYVSAKKQVQNVLELSALPQCEGEGGVKYTESYC